MAEKARILLPPIAAALAAISYLSHIARMWMQRTAAGQSLTGWLIIAVDLGLWAAYYQICLPHERAAKWSTVSLLFLSLCTASSVVYWNG